MIDSATQNSKLKTQNHYVDWHSHILPDVDDGAANLEEAIAIARVLASAGFREVHCTPHSIPGAYDADPPRIRAAIEELSRELDREAIPIRLIAGSEYYCDEFLPARLDDPLPLGDTGMVLMEAPLQATPSLLSHTAFQVLRKGLTPLIAHPERSAILGLEKKKSESRSLIGSVLNYARGRFSTQHSKLNTQNSAAVEHSTLADLLRSMGCRFQGNIGSFAGVYGERVRYRALRYLDKGFYDCLGSDAHASGTLADWLPRGLSEVLDRVGREGLASLLAGTTAWNEGIGARCEARDARVGVQ